MKQKTTFGLGQIAKEAPEWAPWIFRTYFIISKALIGWMAYTKLVDKDTLYEMGGFIMMLADPVMYGLSKMFGIVAEEADNTKTLIADKQVESDGEITKVVPVTIPPSETTRTQESPEVIQPEGVIKSN